MKLYHGTNIDFDSIDLNKCKPNKDFGKGFYLTDIKEQAKNMAIRRCDFTQKGTPVIQEYEFDENSHDRFIRTSNNWDITLGRGLHFYQNMNPNKDSRNYFQMGTYDLSLRPCLKARFIFTKRNAEE